MEQLKNFGSRIAHLRRTSGYTQEELGKRVNVSAQAVSKWENGDSFPDLSLIVGIAETFDCSTDYLLGREGGLSSLLPQIRNAFVRMTEVDKVGFLGDIINATEVLIPTNSDSLSGHPSLVHIYLGPTGIGLWAKERLACIATTTFLEEAIESLHEQVGLPFSLLPEEIRPVLLALLRKMDDLKPDYAIDEKTLTSLLPSVGNIEQVLTDCIELGFVDRVRGGYRLNFEADITLRLLAIVHQTINKRSTINVTIGEPS